MRRLSAHKATPGMVAGRTVADVRGIRLCAAGEPLTASLLMNLTIYGIGELVVSDQRTADVPVEPLWGPEAEAQAVQALTQVYSECRGSAPVDDAVLDGVVREARGLAARPLQGALGEANMGPCDAAGDAACRLPVRAAGLAALLAVKTGAGAEVAESAAAGAMLMDIGAAERGHDEGGDHAVRGAMLLRQSKRVSSAAVRAVLEHHELADGSGKPRGLKAHEAAAASRFVAVATAYFNLIAPGAGRKPLTRHQAVEYVLAYGGERFDAKASLALARDVAVYPAGTMVTLNTGERGVVVDSRTGHIGRPVVRVLYDDMGYEVAGLVEIDLASARERDRAVADTPEY